MPAEPSRDWVEALLKEAPAWEPPPGFALHVADAARRAEPEPGGSPAQVRRRRLFLAGWWRTGLTMGVSARVAGAVWVVRQYLALLPGRGHSV
jgi:hypothetical protein